MGHVNIHWPQEIYKNLYPSLHACINVYACLYDESLMVNAAASPAVFVLTTSFTQEQKQRN